MIRILHLFGTIQAMDHWMRYEFCGTERSKTFLGAGRKRVEVMPGVEIQCELVQGFDSIEKLRGHTFDALMVHDSFHRIGAQRRIDTHTLLWELRVITRTTGNQR